MIIEFITYLILYWIWFTILLIDPSPNFDPYFTQLPIIFSFWKQFRTFQYIFFVKWAKSKQHFQNKSWRSSKMVSGGQEYPYDFAKQMKNLLNSKFTQNTFEDQNKEQFTRDRNMIWDSDPLSDRKWNWKRNNWVWRTKYVRIYLTRKWINHQERNRKEIMKNTTKKLKP